MKINCTVGVVVSSIDCSKLNSIQVPESDIGAHLGTLLENEEEADVIFSVSGEKFRAHKLILAARSTVFENEVFSGMDEDCEEIVVTDMEPKVFKVILSESERKIPFFLSFPISLRIFLASFVWYLMFLAFIC